ncbi:MAG: hypothetical protein O3A01_06155 [bacterium]|nr:hypothetical protein [bacterium]
MASKSVAVRVFKEGDATENWESHPINSHLPLFLGAEGNVDNINRRVKMLYLKSPGIVKVRWHFNNDEAHGFWVEKD